MTEAAASVSAPPSSRTGRLGSRKLLAGLALVTLVLVGTILKIGWFSTAAPSSTASPGGAGNAAGAVTARTGPGTAGSGTTGSSSQGSSPRGSGTVTSATSGVTTDASTATSPGTTGGAGGVIAAVGLVQADEAVLTSTSPTVSVALVNTLATYAGGINAKDLATAYTAYSPGQQARSPFATWSKGVQGSRLSAVRILSAAGAVKKLASGPVVVDVTFVSHQPGAAGPVPGQTCTVWSLEYTMTPNPDVSGYLIDRARPSSGTGHAAC